MPINAIDITTGANHAAVQNLRGWSIRGTTPVIRLRAELVTGQILVTLPGDDTQLLDDIINAPLGTFVELVSGTLTEGVLYYD